MKVGFDAKRLFNNFTGLGNYSRTLLHNLQLNFPDNQYYLYTPSARSIPPAAGFLNNPDYRVFIPDTLFRSYWRSVSIIKQLKIDKPDIYHGLSHELPLNIRKTEIRSVVTMHDLIFKIYPLTYTFIDRNIYDRKFRYSCLESDKIVAISESTKNDIVRLYNIDPAKIEVIYQSCHPLYYSTAPIENSDLIRKKYGLPDQYLLYVGSVSERKNVATIIKAYDFLPGDLKIPLVIVGNGRAYKNKVQKLIEERDLGKNVIWINNLSDTEELKTLYTNATIFIYPSVYEGFGIPVIEALLCRVPVITSNVSSLPEAGGPSSYYIDPSDPEHLAHGIIKILGDTKYKDEMIKTGYSYAMKMFDARKNASQLMSLYKSLI